VAFILGMLDKIVSGGQTGADRAGLDWAISRGIPHGGWCPKGRRAEDEVIPAEYQLQEMRTTSYLKRTEQNVIDSDGTVILSIKPMLSSGSKRTAEFARKHKRPFLHIHSATVGAAEKLAAFVRDNQIRTLNVAGPRASSEPAIADFVAKVLDEAFAKTGDSSDEKEKHTSSECSGQARSR
jgi:hypothetical protein